MLEIKFKSFYCNFCGNILVERNSKELECFNCKCLYRVDSKGKLVFKKIK